MYNFGEVEVYELYLTLICDRSSHVEMGQQREEKSHLL